MSGFVRRVPSTILLATILASALSGSMSAEDGLDPAPVPLADALGDEGRALFREGRALFDRHEYARARERFEEARSKFEAIPDLSAAGWMLARIADCDAACGRQEEALKSRRECHALMVRAHGDGPHLDVAKSLASLGDTLWDVGRSSEAIESLERSILMFDALTKDPHRYVADIVGNLSYYLMKIRRPDRALPYCERAVEMRRTIHGGRHAQVAMAIVHLASCLERLHRQEEALQKHGEALAMYRGLRNEDDSMVASMLNNVGLCLLSLHRPSEAEPPLRQALEVRQLLAPGDASVVAQSLSNLGMCLDAQGRSEEAYSLHLTALETRERLYGGGHASVATTLLNLGACLENLGRYEEARGQYETALAIRERLAPRGGDALVARALGRIGRVLIAHGQPAEALPRFEKAVDIFRRGGEADWPALGQGLTLLGDCQLLLGRPQEALPHLEEALELVRRLRPDGHPSVALVLNDLGTCLVQLGRPEEALPLAKRSLEIRREAHQGDHAEVAVALGNVAVTLRSLGRVEEALALYREALAMRRHLHEKEHPALAVSLNNLAGCLASLGRVDEALPLYEKALELGRETGSPDTHVWAANLAGLLLEDKHDPKRAVDLFKEAIAQIEELRRDAVGLDEQDRGVYFEHLKRFDAFGGMVRAELARGSPDEVLRYLERGRARSLLDLLARSQLDALGEVERQARARSDEKLIAEIEELTRRLRESDREVGRLTHALGVARSRQDLGTEDKRRRIDELTQQLTAAHAAQREVLRERAQVIRNQLDIPWAADPEDIQHLLAKNELLLGYSLSDRGSLVVAVAPHGTPIRAFALSMPDGSPATDADVARLVDRFLAEILREGRAARGVQVPAGTASSAPDPVPVGHRLLQTLVPEILRQEVLAASRIYVVPHGPLHRLPFEALVLRIEEKAPVYWIDEGPPIAYGTSGSALLWARQRRDDQIRSGALRDAVLVGDPRFSGPEDEADRPEVPEKGVFVFEVNSGSPGDRAGVRPGDVILEYDGEATENDRDLRDRIHDRQAAWEDGKRPSNTVEVVLWRRGELLKTAVPVGALGISVALSPPREAWKRVREQRLDPGRQSIERAAAERYGRLQPLPGTRREVIAIGKTLSRERPGGPMTVTSLLGNDATEARLFAAAPRARYLHLATHQIADETDRASYSGLALTLPEVPTAQDDGFLKLIDLLEHWRSRLMGCEIVVLSACESQRGRMQRDEGVFAMPWGFQFAGSPTVIASQWRVDDKSTALLMSDFYSRLDRDADAGKLAAFTAARRALRRKHPEPYFWAPFVYIGDPR